MRTEGIELRRELEGLEGAWDDLAQRTGAVPFLRPGWIRAWWVSFGRGDLAVFTAWRDGALVGVLPMRRVGGELSSLTNSHTPRFGIVAEDDHARRELARAVVQGGARRIEVGYIDPGGRSHAALTEAFAAARYRWTGRVQLRSPHVALDTSWSDYEGRFGRKRIAEFRRRRRRLEEIGKVTVDVEDGTENLPELLDEGFAVEAAGWKGESGTAIAASQETRRFYTQVARWAAGAGILRLGFLRLDGRALAFDLSLETGGVHYLVKTGFDPAYRAFGPGLLIRYEMLSRAFAVGLRVYDFVGTNDPWKREWTEDVRERVQLRAFRGSVAGLADWAVQVPGRAVARQVRDAVRSPRRG